jgi:hypothetical protein
VAIIAIALKAVAVALLKEIDCYIYNTVQIGIHIFENNGKQS